MSDRELLLLAAKAAGISDAVYSDGVLRDMYDPRDGQAGIEVNHQDSLWKSLALDGVWNPLTDDGDAFRLACSLRLDISFLEGFEQIIVDDYHGSNRAEEDYQPDMAAASRRAVVRAAAEIGRTMK